jgi:hypothetical protein
VTLNGERWLVAMMVDNPIGGNGGYYRLLPLDTVLQRDGQWHRLPFHSPVLPVHLALLPSGKVLIFAGSGRVGTKTRGRFTLSAACQCPRRRGTMGSEPRPNQRYAYRWTAPLKPNGMKMMVMTMMSP